MNILPFLVKPDATVRQTMACIDRNARGVALVADDSHRLLALVTDGDIRRALLARLELDAPVSAVIEAKARRTPASALTALVGTGDEELLALMRAQTLRHIPIVDPDGRVVDMAILDDMVKESELPMTAVVVAGGRGTRLRPLTAGTPKPMLPVGDRPLLERLIDQLRQSGIRRVSLTTHYQPEAIANHFGDGHAFGVEIGYLHEATPLGTAGALSGLSDSTEPLLVINADILTTLDFRAFLAFHSEHQADLTIAVREQDVQVPYGVVETRGVDVVAIVEKPIVRHFINAGVYLMNPSVCRYVPVGCRYDMPDLIAALLLDKQRVISFPIREYWRDIGQIEDYEKAVADVLDGTV